MTMRALASSLFICLWTTASAFAWDPVGDLLDPGRIARNFERETRAVADAAGRLAREALVQANAPAFAAWLRKSSSDSDNYTKPIPLQIRSQFEGFFPDQVLDRARYRVGDVGVFNLASLSIMYGGASAVTLDSVIVFENINDAETNALLWAHELEHVRQFESWNVEDFAVRYLRDWRAVEDEAYAKERSFQKFRSISPLPEDIDGNGKPDGIKLVGSQIRISLSPGGQELITVPSPDYNTQIGVWLALDVNMDRCYDLVHIVTEGVDNPHYAHTHLSRCDGTFSLPDKIQFNAPGIANEQGDYNTANGYWDVKVCGGRQVLAHNPMLPDYRNHFWTPTGATPPYSISNQCN